MHTQLTEETMIEQQEILP